jgi:hypothetical protein
MEFYPAAGNYFAACTFPRTDVGGKTMEFVSNRDRLGNVGSATSKALASATDTVGQFLIYLRDRPIGGELRRTDELPETKRALIDAFRLLISHERRIEQSAQLRKVGLYLAQFRGNETQSSEMAFLEGDEWDQVFAEQAKLEQLFKLSARYARNESNVYASSGPAFIDREHRADH